MYWIIIIILALYFIFSYPEFFFFLSVILLSILIYKIHKIIDKRKSEKQEPYSSSNSPIQKNEGIPFNVSFEFDRVDTEYPLFDATKIPIVKYCEYKVKGKNPKTNRQKTVRVVAKQGTPDNVIFERSHLLEPYTITPYFEEASVAQIDFAQNLNIIYPPDCSLEDMSALISRQLGQLNGAYIAPTLLEYAAANNIYISPYTNTISGAYILIRSLEPNERIVFFVYLIYCGSSKTPIGNPQNCPHYHVFCDFVNTISDVEETAKYIKEHCTGKTLLGDVDRRNKKMACLHDVAKQYLTNVL